jgi:hypothetical protein
MILSISESYHLTLLCRFAMGVFGSNSTVTKSFIGDISEDSRMRSWGFAMYRGFIDYKVNFTASNLRYQVK